MRSTSTNRTPYAVISAITLSAVLSGCGVAIHQRLESMDPAERIAELKAYDTDKLCMGYTNLIVQPETEKDIAAILHSRGKTVCSTVRRTRVVETPIQFSSSSAATALHAAPTMPSQSEPATSQVAAAAPLTNAMTPGETERQMTVLAGRGGFERFGVIGGVPYEYSIFDDGHITGSVNGPLEKYTYIGKDPDRWIVIGKVNPMTDKRTWYIRNDGAGLLLFMAAPERISAVCVVGADFPGRPYAVRIDKNKAARFQDGDCKSGYRGNLLAQILSGTTVRTQYYEWPYDYSKNAEGNAAPFEQAQKLLAHLIQTYG